MSDKPPPDPALDDLPEKLRGLTNLKDTLVDVRSPIARAPGSRPLERPSTDPRAPATAGPLPRPRAADGQRNPTPAPGSLARPTSARLTPTATPRPPSPAPRPNEGDDDVRAERDKALQMVAAREGILQVVAHDLRNPLNLVKVGGSLLTRMANKPPGQPIDPAKVQQIADTLVIAVRRMERLITDLLDLEALDKGQLRLVRGPANANAIVEEVLLEMRPKAAEKDVEILAELPRQIVIIDCDKDRIAQILENLISNAIRFTPSGKHIIVRLQDTRGEARFEVADQGPGIADEDLRRIFDRYYRAEVPQGRGLGLGLSICLGLVRAHDGGLWAESATGQGTTFVFTMPRRDLARDTVEIPAVQLQGIRKTRSERES